MGKPGLYILGAAVPSNRFSQPLLRLLQIMTGNGPHWEFLRDAYA